MYSYKTVEHALSLVHGLGDPRPAFRGRIQHLQRLGLVPASPGRGKKISYDLEAVALWAFALELEQLGMDPTSLKFVLQKTWQQVCPSVVGGNKDQDEFIVLDPNILSSESWPHGFMYVVISSLEFKLNGDVRRAMIINLTALHRSLIRALEPSSVISNDLHA